MDKDWVTFNMKLKPDMAAQLDKTAKEAGISRAALIRVIVAQHYGSKLS